MDMRSLLALLLLLTLAFPVLGQDAPPPAKIADLLRLLQDPEVRAWVERQPAASTTSAPSPSDTPDIAGWEARTRSRINGVIAAVPRIPAEIAASAERVRADAADHGFAPVFVVFAMLLLIGASAEAVYRRLIPKHMVATDGRHTIGSAVLSEVLPVLVFAAAMAVVFFGFSWPPLPRITLLVYLVTFVVYRLLSTAIALEMPPTPLSRRIRLFLGVLLIAIAFAVLGHTLGVEPAVREAIAYLFSVILLVLAVAVLLATSRSRTAKSLLAATLAIIWLVWCARLHGLFWIGIYALLLPSVLGSVGRIAHKVGATWPNDGTHDFRRVFLVRGSRAVIVGIACIWLAYVWHYNLDAVAPQDLTVRAIVLGLLKGVAVILVADLLWALAKVAIDRKLERSAADANLPPEEDARRSRLRTLLPIFRNGLAAVVLLMSALLVLSQLGVEIAPLIAGAGVFGVALGFGSQTLVKDVISGIFFMLDDAFRVGEYIQSKSYKGTVESFSLRSVRLRHHRGPVYTVPFGELGAVENMSRDWAVVKFLLSVSYDTDVAKVKAITKVIGKSLKEDPEFEPFIIENLKMKGVEEFGDYGIKLSFGMTLKPTSLQSMIRRRAYAMLREAFNENSIEFAQPTVHVGGDEKNGAAAATAAARAKAEAEAAAAVNEG